MNYADLISSLRDATSEDRKEELVAAWLKKHGIYAYASMACLIQYYLSHYDTDSDRAWLIEALVRNGASVEAEDESGWRPLHRAAKRGCVVCIETLLKVGADPLARKPDGDTPLHCSTAGGRNGIRATEILAAALLAAGGHIDDRNKQGKTPAHSGAAFSVLSALGADPNARDYMTFRGVTPWSSATELADKAESMAAQGKCVRAWCIDKFDKLSDERSKPAFRTPLHYAADRFDVPNINALLEAGADRNARDMHGLTPIAFAKKFADDWRVYRYTCKAGGPGPRRHSGTSSEVYELLG